MKRKSLIILLAAAALSGCTSRTTAPEQSRLESLTVQTEEQTAEHTSEPSTLEADPTADEWLPTGETTEITVGDLLNEFKAGDGAFFDNVFLGLNNPGSGGYVDYDDFAGSVMKNEYSDQVDSLYLAECIDPLTFRKSQELFGNTEKWREFYQVRLVRDLVDGSEPDKVVYIRKSGGIEYQDPSDPPYSPGEKFVVLLNAENDGYCDSVGGGMLNYDIYDEDGTLWAYSRDNYILDDLGFTGSENIKESRVTSTTSNPARYTQKLPLDELSAALRGIFEENSFTRHFRPEGTQD